jgi:hypothetical protein
MSEATASLRQRGFGETLRRDAWWVQPAVTFVILLAFVVFATWRAFENANYQFGNYLSPLYSPVLFGEGSHSWFGPQPTWWPSWLPFSPALLILPFPGGFRLTCYYYRGAYYKAFWADPPNCSVGEPRKGYLGERWFPLVIQNIHRYFLYFALIFNVILTWDAIKGFWFIDPANGQGHFGIGVGSLVLATNAILLAGYSFGCHSLRHLVGGVKDVISKSPVRRASYACVSCFNRAHMRWAWASLIWVSFTDIYVRMLAAGVWHDWRIL